MQARHRAVAQTQLDPTHYRWCRSSPPRKARKGRLWQRPRPLILVSFPVVWAERMMSSWLRAGFDMRLASLAAPSRHGVHSSVARSRVHLRTYFALAPMVVQAVGTSWANPRIAGSPRLCPHPITVAHTVSHPRIPWSATSLVSTIILEVPSSMAGLLPCATASVWAALVIKII